MLCVGTITLPDGRQAIAIEHVTIEYDTNATVPQGDMGVTILATGEELSQEELNAEVVVGARRWYLHEYVGEYADWKQEEEDDDAD